MSAVVLMDLCRMNIWVFDDEVMSARSALNAQREADLEARLQREQASSVHVVF